MFPKGFRMASVGPAVIFDAQFLHIVKISAALVLLSCWGIYSVATAFYIGRQSYRRWLSLKPMHASARKSDSDLKNYYIVNENRAQPLARPTETVASNLHTDGLGAEEKTDTGAIDDEALRKHRAIMLEHDRASARDARNEYLTDTFYALGGYLLVSAIVFVVSFRLTGWRVRWW